ncbi:MAG: class I SAM-dependent methyltransferase [Rhodospirillales bacterium]|nr:class I SAM-dependent methyltransferase [Rhodospirillales bacterium]
MSQDIFTLYPCDLCGSTELIEIPCAPHYMDGRPLHVCSACGFVQAAYRRTPEALQKMWAEEIYRADDAKISDKTYTARIPAVVARQTFAIEFLAENVDIKGKSLCDIGAGEGQFLEMLRAPRFDMDVFGIEPSTENCAILDELGFANFPGTMEEYAANSDGRTFDVASLIWTLENCQSASGVLAAAHDVVKPGGHLVMATGSRILMPFKKPLQYYLGPNVDAHPFHFSANALTSLMHKAGFKVIAHNRFIDSDYMVLIGERVESGDGLPLPKDDGHDVVDFFERWHRETQTHYADW